MTPCKWMTVTAYGVTRWGRVVAATNYNETECTGEEGKCGCIHAEISLLNKMPQPYSVYVSHSPCLNCAKALLAAGVRKVHYVYQHRVLDGLRLLIGDENTEVYRVSQKTFDAIKGGR